MGRKYSLISLLHIKKKKKNKIRIDYLISSLITMLDRKQPKIAGI